MIKKMLIVIVVAIVLTSCSAPITEPTPAPIPTAAPTIAQTPEPTPEPTPELESTLTEEEKNMMPEVDGLYRTKEGEEYVYRALSGNEYGLGEGEYAGLFRENVFVTNSLSEECISIEDSIKKGGIVLNSIIVEKIMNERELLSDDASKHITGNGWVPLPFDISALSHNDAVNIDYNFESNFKKFVMISSNSSKELPVINIAHGINNYILTGSGVKGSSFLITERLAYSDGPRDAELCISSDSGFRLRPEYYTTTLQFLIDTPANNESISDKYSKSNFGDILFKKSNSAAFFSDGFPSEVWSHIDYGLFIDEVPVFVKANE